MPRQLIGRQTVVVMFRGSTSPQLRGKNAGGGSCREHMHELRILFTVTVINLIFGSTVDIHSGFVCDVCTLLSFQLLLSAHHSSSARPATAFSAFVL